MIPFKMDPVPRIIVTSHARRRAVERFGEDVERQLDTMALHSHRTGARTRDGLRAWKSHMEPHVVFLMLEKSGFVNGGLYELEVITVITPDMLRTLRKIQSGGER